MNYHVSTVSARKYNTELCVFIGSLEVMLYQTYGLENLVSIAVCTGDTL